MKGLYVPHLGCRRCCREVVLTEGNVLLYEPEVLSSGFFIAIRRPPLDELYNCYQSYSKMASSCTYYFVVAKKGKKYSINIQFELDQFIHLTGISHLDDLPFTRNSPGDLRKMIEENKLTMNDLAKSSKLKSNIKDIPARIACLARIDEFLQSENTIMDYSAVDNPYSKLKADWLIHGTIAGELCYLFLKAKPKKKDRFSGDYICSSIFPHRGIDYSQGARPMVTLLKQRNNTIDRRTKTLYQHPSYQCG